MEAIRHFPLSMHAACSSSHSDVFISPPSPSPRSLSALCNSKASRHGRKKPRAARPRRDRRDVVLARGSAIIADDGAGLAGGGHAVGGGIAPGRVATEGGGGHLQAHVVPGPVHRHGGEAGGALRDHRRADGAADGGGRAGHAHRGGARARGQGGSDGLARGAIGAEAVRRLLRRRDGEPRLVPPRHQPQGRRHHPVDDEHGGAGPAVLRRGVQEGRREEPAGAVRPVARQHVRDLPLALQHDQRLSSS
jgi:hypothetical protein